MARSPDEIPDIAIPAGLLPGDGRFGSGPSKVRPEAVAALAAAGTSFLGTSHRQPAVRFMVAELRNGLSELFSLPDGYEVILGNGGTTAFWDAACFGLIERRSQHLSFGEFSSKFAAAVAAVPFLDEPEVIDLRTGDAPRSRRRRTTSTPTPTRTTRRRPAWPWIRSGHPMPDCVLVDATSAAGGLRFDPSQVDVYYFAPQKGLAADGGLWLAACSPAAVERIERLATSGRWTPPFLDLRIALENSRLDQTYNTPALATILLANQQVQWILHNGGLPWSAGRCDRSAEIVYGWAEASEIATPFVADPADRSHVVATIDFVDVDRRPGAGPGPATPTASSTPSRTASWVATSSVSACSPPSSPTTSPPSPPASTTSPSAW